MYREIPQTHCSHLRHIVNEPESTHLLHILTLTSQHRALLLLASRLAVTCSSMSRSLSAPTAGSCRQTITLSVLDKETEVFVGVWSSSEDVGEMDEERTRWIENSLGISICRVEDSGMLCLPVESCRHTLCISPTSR